LHKFFGYFFHTVPTSFVCINFEKKIAWVTFFGDFFTTHLVTLVGRVARFFMVHDTKTGKNVSNERVKNIPKWPQNIPNGHKMYQHFPI
jgi:hypothetical protein